MKILSFSSESGATLVELVIALIIIALIILGGGMFFFYGRVNIIREAHRRAALLVASQRLEALKAATWDDIALYPPSYQTYYITYGSDWEISPIEAKDTEVAVDNLSDGEILTEAQWRDDDPSDGIDSYDYLKVTVTVEWTDSTTNTVSSTTLIAPRE
jgi:Tfp pilus assembly protein PilV